MSRAGCDLASPYLWIAVGGGVVAFFASARSLQIGPGVPVIAVTSIAGNASSIPAGIIVFGDPLGDDALSVVVRVLAFLLVVGAAAIIPAPTRVGSMDDGAPSAAPSPAQAAAGWARRFTAPGETPLTRLNARANAASER